MESRKCGFSTGASVACGSPLAPRLVASLATILLLSLMHTTTGSAIYLTPSSSAEYTPWLGSECDSSCSDPLQPCSFPLSRASTTTITVTNCDIELVGSFSGYAMLFGDINSEVFVSNLSLRAPSGYSGSLSMVYQDSIAFKDFYAPTSTISVTYLLFNLNGNVSFENATFSKVSASGSNLAISNSRITPFPPSTDVYNGMGYSIASTTTTLPVRLRLENVTADPESPLRPTALLWVGQQSTVTMVNVAVGHRSLLISAPLADVAIVTYNSRFNFSTLLKSSLYVSTVNFTAVSTVLTVKNDNSSEQHALMTRDAGGSSFMNFALSLFKVTLLPTHPALRANPIVLFSSTSSGLTNCTLSIKNSMLSNIDFGDLPIINATLSDSIAQNSSGLTFSIQSPFEGICISNLTTGAEAYSTLPTVPSSALYASTFGVAPAVSLLVNDTSTGSLDFSHCTSRVDIAALTLMHDTVVIGGLGIYGNISSYDDTVSKQLILATGSRVTVSSNTFINSVLIDSSAGQLAFTPLLGSSGSIGGDALSSIQFADQGLSNFWLDWPSLNPLLLPSSDQTYTLASSYSGSIDTGYRKYNGWAVRIYTDATLPHNPLIYRYIRQQCAQSCSAPYDLSVCINTRVCSCPAGWSGPNCDCKTSLIPGATCALSGGPVYVVNGSLNIGPGSTTAVPSDSTLIISGNLTVDGVLALGDGALVLASGDLSANGQIRIRTKVREFRFSGKCAIYSTTSIQAASMNFTKANLVYLELDASAVTTDGSCIRPVPSNALDSYFNVPFSSRSTTFMSNQATWDLTLLTNGNVSNPQKLNALEFEYRILDSEDTKSSIGMTPIVAITQAKGSTCSKPSSSPGLMYLVVTPCTATSSLPWYAVTIPLIVIVILVIALLIAIMVLKYGQDKILPWHQVIYNPYNPRRRVTLLDME